jgi:hypothetical protein
MITKPFAPENGVKPFAIMETPRRDAETPGQRLRATPQYAVASSGAAPPDASGFH